ncbi:MAG: hypothetical protein E7350_04315 [Clostridiales bacterium]|nr:hypothetical protein [Clostridiales bacterium]
MVSLKKFSAEKKEQKGQADSEMMDQVMDKYRNKSEEELIESLMEAARNAKKDGSFDEQSLSSFVSLVSPHLSDSQKDKLSNLISVIKLED